MESKLYPSESEYNIKVDTEKLSAKLRGIREEMTSKIFGQDRAIDHIVRRLAIYEAGLKDPNRPVGAMIFAGPTGVGKTWTAKVLAQAWIGQETLDDREPALIIECANLSERHSIHSLIGAPFGYVGYNDPPIFSQHNINKYHLAQLRARHKDEIAKIKAQVYGFERALVDSAVDEILLDHYGSKSVVVFDEIEKAHNAVWNLLLNILEEGKITLANGEVTDFSGVLFILTTNVGSREIIKAIEERSLGFRVPKEKGNELDQDIYETTKKILEKTFPPELLRRLAGEIIVFRTLTPQAYRNILNVFLQDIVSRVAKKLPIMIRYSSDFIEFLLKEGIDVKYGAGVLRAVTERYVLYSLAIAIDNGELKAGDQVLFAMQDGKPVLNRTRRSKSMLLSISDVPPPKPPLNLTEEILNKLFINQPTTKAKNRNKKSPRRDNTLKG